MSDDVDLESNGSARGRGSVVLRARLNGGVGEDNRALLLVGDAILPSVGEGFPSSSVHCKCRITDFVAHWADCLRGRTVQSQICTYRHLCTFGCEPLKHVIRCCTDVMQPSIQNRITPSQLREFELRDHLSSFYGIWISRLQ